MKDMKPMFSNDKIYKTDLSNTVQYGFIPKEVLFEKFKDGRVAGLLNESLAEALFKNIAKTELEGAAFDVYDTKWGTTYEVRSVTKGGTKTCPSAMVGVGRTYNLEEHTKKMQNINYFLFMDVRKFPEIYIYPIKAQEPELMVKSITSKQFDKLIARRFSGIEYEVI